MTVESAPNDGRPAASREIVPFVPTVAAPAARAPMRYGIWLAGCGFVLGLGAVGVHMAQNSALWTSRQAVTTAQVLTHLQEEISHLKSSVDTLRTAEQTKQDESLRGLKRSVDTLKQEIEQVRSSDTTALAQLSSKIDRTDHDPNPKLAEIMARLDKIDHEPKPSDPSSQKLADLAGRVDRMEHQVSAATPTGSIPAPPTAVARPLAAITPPPKMPQGPAPKQVVATATSTEPKALPAKQPTVDAWVVRDVYDGMALVEARRGDLREVAPGQFLPGAGEIQSIERRGRGWVVLTSRGVIETNTF